MNLWISLWILFISCFQEGEQQGRSRQPISIMSVPTASRMPDAPFMAPVVAPLPVQAPPPVSPVLTPSNSVQMRPSVPANQNVPPTPPLVRHRPANKENDDADSAGNDNTGKTGIAQSFAVGNLLGSVRPSAELDPCSPANIPIAYTIRRCASTGDCPPGFFCDVSAWKCGSHWCNSFQGGALVFR